MAWVAHVCVQERGLVRLISRRLGGSDLAVRRDARRRTAVALAPPVVGGTPRNGRDAVVEPAGYERRSIARGGLVPVRGNATVDVAQALSAKVQRVALSWPRVDAKDAAVAHRHQRYEHPLR